MIDPSLALQDAIEAALRGDADLAAAMGGVVVLFTVVAPNGTPKPYLVIGEDQVVPDEAEGTCGEADDAFTRVNVWTLSADGVEASRREAKVIAGHVRRIFSAGISVEGFTVVDHGVELVQHLTEGLTGHSVVDHRFNLGPA